MAVVHVTTDNFEQEVMQSDKPVLIDFWASWCGPCMMLGPVVEELAGEVDDVKICKVNVDEQMDLRSQRRISESRARMSFWHLCTSNSTNKDKAGVFCLLY